MATPTSAQLLTLTQWFSPAFPVGAFAYSHGLEQAIDTGHVTTAEQCEAWVHDVLAHGSGWNDCLFLAAGYRSDDAGPINTTCRAFAASSERLAETELQGAAFCAAVSEVWGRNLDGLCYPVAVGAAARHEGLPLGITAQMYLQAFASTLVSVAVRLVPLGQTEGQRLIKRLNPLCVNVASKACAGSLEDLCATAFWADIAAMRHETQYSRTFRS